MKSKIKYFKIIIVILIFGLIGVFIKDVFFNSTPIYNSNKTIHIVAAENFWGSLVAQIGGSRVQVQSIIADPTADPHEYQSNTTTARQIATANYVILNGAGYDSWGNKLISSSTNNNRQVLIVAHLLNKRTGSNPHFWYNPNYVNIVIANMKQTLIKLSPKNKKYFEANYKKLQASLSVYQNRIKAIKKEYAGTKVAATEDVFSYLAQAAGLNLISPPAFIQAVAEGNDPPASSVVQFQQQIVDHQPKVLVYNLETVTPLTTSMRVLAKNNHIPLVAVTEIVEPPKATFQNWMNKEIINLQNALNNSKQ